MVWLLNKKFNSGTVHLKVDALDVRVDYKKIKNVYLRVDRAGGRVRVSVPLAMSEQAVKLFIRSKYDWIEQQQLKVHAQTPQLPLECVNGCYHEFLGKRYEMCVVERNSVPEVRLRSAVMELVVRPRTSLQKRQSILNEWYRQQLKERIPLFIARYEPLMAVRVQSFGVKNMKTRWGTCNTRAGRIWLGLALAKKPIDCLEYVVVHEMVHLLEPSHNKRFYALMDQFLPDWRQTKIRLNGIAVNDIENV